MMQRKKRKGGKEKDKKFIHNVKKFFAKKLFKNTDHSLERWNSRVQFPKMENKQKLNEFVEEMYALNKIEHIYKDLYLIDNDIVAVLEICEDCAVITTYYGRCTINPLLYNIETLVRNMSKYGKINLESYCA